MAQRLEEREEKRPTPRSIGNTVAHVIEEFEGLSTDRLIESLRKKGITGSNYRLRDDIKRMKLFQACEIIGELVRRDLAERWNVDLESKGDDAEPTTSDEEEPQDSGGGAVLSRDKLV